MAAATARMSAEDRRADLLLAAAEAFAPGGVAGASTESIARRAGISQPYLFRLFPTKKALFLAVVDRSFNEVGARFERAAKGLAGEEALEAMGESYNGYLAERDQLLFQLHV